MGIRTPERTWSIFTKKTHNELPLQNKAFYISHTKIASERKRHGEK